MLPLLNSLKQTLLNNRNCLTDLKRFDHDIQSSHKVTDMEKRFLVWTKKYKTVAEVPPFVGQATMERCRNRMRIKIANYMMGATLVACLAMVYLGKQDHKRGESVAKQNIEWHKQMNEKFRQEEMNNK